MAGGANNQHQQVFCLILMTATAMPCHVLMSGFWVFWTQKMPLCFRLLGITNLEMKTVTLKDVRQFARILYRQFHPGHNDPEQFLTGFVDAWHFR